MSDDEKLSGEMKEALQGLSGQMDRAEKVELEFDVEEVIFKKLKTRCVVHLHKGPDGTQ